LFRAQESEVGRGRGAGRIEGQTGGGVLGLQGKRDVPPATLRRMLTFPKIACFIGSDPKKPGLKLAPALKGIDVPNHVEKRLLADLFRILLCKIVPELENEPPHRRVMEIE
jgi:hypothetical protein